MKKVLLIQPAYPYGKKQIYLGESLYIVAAQLMQCGFKVDVVDLNMSPLPSADHYDYAGITVTGAPYIPVAREIIKRFPAIPVLVGGQPIAALEKEVFAEIFGSNAVQVKSDNDMAQALGIEPSKICSSYQTRVVHAYSLIPEDNLRKYLMHEGALFISQGCHFRCAFCAAAKGRVEQFKDLDYFHDDLLFLARKAQSFGIPKLEFYATNLDFFQNPAEICKYLEQSRLVQKRTGVEIKIRCLACLPSFLKADRLIPDLKKICKDGGLWCIGFGVDGTDPAVWKAQKKTQNNLEDVGTCLAVCESFGIQAEILLVMGFPQDTRLSLWRNFVSACKFVFKYKHTMLRPYLAKQFVPGNDNWKLFDNKKIFIQNPDLFYNIDFCMVGSKFTHPRFWHRFYSNAVYLAICWIFGPFGKCATYPLLPLTRNRVWNSFAMWWNKVTPFDR